MPHEVRAPSYLGWTDIGLAMRSGVSPLIPAAVARASVGAGDLCLVRVQQGEGAAPRTVVEGDVVAVASLLPLGAGNAHGVGAHRLHPREGPARAGHEAEASVKAARAVRVS